MLRAAAARIEAFLRSLVELTQEGGLELPARVRAAAGELIPLSGGHNGGLAEAEEAALCRRFVGLCGDTAV